VVPFGVTLVLAALTPAPAPAHTYRIPEDREIVHEAEVLIEATVTAVIPPPDFKPGKQRGASVAVLRVGRVFKGDLKEGTEIGVAFWSHPAGPNDTAKRPDRYEVGEKFVLPLRPREKRYFEGYALPPEEASARWVCTLHVSVCGPRLRGPGLLAAAEMWRAPERHLDDPERREDAIYFLAIQNRLPESILQQLLWADDLDKQSFGWRVAGIVKSRAALVPLVVRAEMWGREIVSWKDDPATEEERQRRSHLRHLHEVVGWTIAEIPFDTDKDGPLLLRLAACGGMVEGVTLRLLGAGPARWELARGLAKEMQARPHAEGLHALCALDTRAAYGPLRKLAADPQSNPRVPARLINEYHTLWAKRYVLERSQDYASGHALDVAYSLVLGSFGFTHAPVNPSERAEYAGKAPEGWKAAWAALRKAAVEELAICDKKGPSFVELPGRLGRAVEWQAHRVGTHAAAALTAAQRRELTRPLVRYADPKAGGLNARAEAVWLVDLYDPGYRRLPVGQLWVAADGTFGFGWLPDRAWGRSEEVAALLRRWC
jgi:hypothetical protein